MQQFKLFGLLAHGRLSLFPHCLAHGRFSVNICWKELTSQSCKRHSLGSVCQVRRAGGLTLGTSNLLLLASFPPKPASWKYKCNIVKYLKKTKLYQHFLYPLQPQEEWPASYFQMLSGEGLRSMTPVRGRYSRKDLVRNIGSAQGKGKKGIVLFT